MASERVKVSDSVLEEARLDEPIVISSVEVSEAIIGSENI